MSTTRREKRDMAEKELLVLCLNCGMLWDFVDAEDTVPIEYVQTRCPGCNSNASRIAEEEDLAKIETAISRKKMSALDTESVLLFARSVAALTRIEGMRAFNMSCEHHGLAMGYGEREFDYVITEYRLDLACADV